MAKKKFAHSIFLSSRQVSIDRAHQAPFLFFGFPIQVLLQTAIPQ
ncbi:hypothetical protein [Desulfovulcanus sp.]